MTTTLPNDDRNEVHLRGRLAAPAELRELPSGDLLAIFRVTVSRPTGDRVKVDSLDCVSDRSKVRRSLERLSAGDVVEIEGSLRRRFWRGPSGPASRYAVDVVSLRAVRAIRAGRRAAGSPARTPASV